MTKSEVFSALKEAQDAEACSEFYSVCEKSPNPGYSKREQKGSDILHSGLRLSTSKHFSLASFRGVDGLLDLRAPTH